MNPHLLAAILAEPDDDAVRLVLSDWLEEHGQPERAEFIRVQVELAAMGEPPSTGTEPHVSGYVCERCGTTGEHWSDLKGRACRACGTEFVRKRRPFDLQHPNYEALRCHERELLGPNVPDGPPHWPRWRDWIPDALLAVVPDGALILDHLHFRRGVIEAIDCAAADWLAHGDAILAAQPVREVELTTFYAALDTERRVEQSAPGVRPERLCRLNGRSDWHTIALTNASPDDYAAVFAAEWPRVKFTLPPLANATINGQTFAALDWHATPGADHID